MDLETDAHKTLTGDMDFANSPIISIAYQQMDIKTGIPEGELTILKSWESDEKTIVNKFLQVFNPFNTDSKSKWDFVPVGFNLSFDFITLLYRWQLHGIKVNSVQLFRCPHLDIQPVVTMFNHGIFKGATLENYSTKEGSGGDIKGMLEKKDYSAIEHYISSETTSFLELYRYMVTRLPELWKTKN